MNIKVKEQKKFDQKILKFSILVFSLLVLSSVAFLLFNKQHKTDTPTNTSNEVPLSISPTPIEIVNDIDFYHYFVPVTGFKELRNNITSDELKSLSIKVLKSEEDTIQKLFPEYKFNAVEDDQFIDQVANGNEIALISWYKLSPKLKLLSLDNSFLFDKSISLENYPLKVKRTIKENEKSSVEIFDPKQINRILSTGEIIPARTVDKFMRNKNNYKYPFESVKPFMDRYDAQVSTFESALQGSGNGNVCALNCFTFVGNEKFMDGMKYSGVDLVSLADNHSMNGGIEGIANTIKLLNSAGIKTIGASPTNLEDATKPEILEIGGVKYGFIAYNNIPSVNDWATDTRGGTARIDDDNYNILPGRVETDVRRAKDMGAQFVIAMMHWGAREYTNDPLPHQKDLAHNLIDNGVDLVIGDHPHWVMSTEFYKDKFIYYGIGNFIFDQDWSIETSQGSLLEMNFYGNKLLSLKIHPHQIYQTQPRLLDENSKEYKQIFSRIWQFTEKI